MLRNGDHRTRGFTLAEALTAVMILSIIGGTVGAIYTSSMRTYSRGITENMAQQKACWAVQRMAQDVRLAMKVTPGDPPFMADQITIRLPNRVFDATERRHLNELFVDAEGAGLVPGRQLAYYRGDADGNLSVTGDHLWATLFEADGATVVRRDLVTDHLVDNPLDASGQPAPIFHYWPRWDQCKALTVRVTVEERHGQRVAQATMFAEYKLRNF